MRCSHIASGMGVFAAKSYQYSLNAEEQTGPPRRQLTFQLWKSASAKAATGQQIRRMSSLPTYEPGLECLQSLLKMWLVPICIQQLHVCCFRTQHRRDFALLQKQRPFGANPSQHRSCAFFMECQLYGR